MSEQVVYRAVDISLHSKVTFSSGLTGQAFTFGDDGLIVIGRAVNAPGSIVCAIGWNGVQKIFDIKCEGPILAEYLDQFSGFPSDVRTYIQLAINSEHSPSYDFFKTFSEVLKGRVKRFDKMQTFASCTHAEVVIQANRLIFGAVTGPSSGQSEGTVVAAEEKGNVFLTLWSTWSVKKEIGTQLGERLSPETTKLVDEFIMNLF
ncbi:hypothetical protein D7Z26_18540 [Cohnella endophytica]|uniref:Uncharacterized protein n=1 Tax=Cohnella endophytica TaxID=2419778 RepID=A0A494XP51_9BACL|nr:hypothetical protein [Cohnella endophytica]RKP49834.1 hypothetical protein D7Z26_18540 [Cohnella endophytica]